MKAIFEVEYDKKTIGIPNLMQCLSGMDSVKNVKIFVYLKQVRLEGE